MSSEVEYKGIKVKGSKLLLILPLLATLGGGLWAGFEGYARWVAMEKKIARYIAPDLSGFTVKLDVLEERLTGIDTNINLKPAYDKMIENYGGNMIYDNCLNVDFSQIDYDFVLTSPPYINLEKYECM